MDEIKIILVDDNQNFRDGLRFYLVDILGYKVINEASNGEECLQLNNINEADIILMDISMPKLNGIKASKQLLADTKHNIIAITSYEEKTYLTELIESGIKGCVFKKDIHDNLNDAIVTVLQSRLYFPKNINLGI